MKQFLLFGGDNYYPSGGWGDFKGSFDTVSEAVESRGGGDWWHIVDNSGYVVYDHVMYKMDVKIP